MTMDKVTSNVPHHTPGNFERLITDTFLNSSAD